MGRIFICLILVTLILGCKREEKPAGVLSEAEMVNVLMQMYLAEERLSRISITYDSSQKLIPYFRKRVFSLTGVPDSTYRKSMEYYMANPKQLDYIYSALIDSLSLREQVKPQEQAKPDGLPE
ncbi:MAG: DUF4296 domain-containing protein [Cyclobacteriaceae bacterium]|jgi:hypothetical protein|nr:DUF4296 domain-containing protein [Cyclobacteriaceae bacterium]